MKGIVIGKFYPPHKGHHYLIDTAIQNSDEVDVLVVDNPTYHIPATQRAKWLQEYHPTARVQIIPDINDDDNSPAWAQHTLQFLGYRPDMVFSSEPYGETWAAAMQCAYTNVDIARTTVPISGTKVRQDILESWNYLSDPVRTGLALRSVVVGAESTGTTTLSKDLAHELRVPWVPELGRSYTESIAPTKSDWQDEDFYRIGQLQQAYENELATRSDGIIVCDTNATATELWQQRYMGATTKKMERIAAKDKADVYIITSDDIPFVQDGTRDGEHIRHQMHTWFITHIKKTGVPYIIVAGSRTERLAVAKKAATAMIATRRIIPGVV
jgi:NadR type nicotinamide-nucleotide adenylyltransferase